MKREELLLYAVTDRRWLGKETIYEQVEKALKGGVTFLQLREKDIEEELFLEEAKKIKQLCQKYNVPFVINDDVELALKVGADGVHVGQKDMAAGTVRKLLGKNKIIGVSARTPEQAKAAEEGGADYISVGAIFGTDTKDDAVKVNQEVLKAITSITEIPVIAIGGINENNVNELKGCGICGVAVISSVFAQENIEKATRNLKREVEKTVNAK